MRKRVRDNVFQFSFYETTVMVTREWRRDFIAFVEREREIYIHTHEELQERWLEVHRTRWHLIYVRYMKTREKETNNRRSWTKSSFVIIPRSDDERARQERMCTEWLTDGLSSFVCGCVTSLVLLGDCKCHESSVMRSLLGSCSWTVIKLLVWRLDDVLSSLSRRRFNSKRLPANDGESLMLEWRTTWCWRDDADNRGCIILLVIRPWLVDVEARGVNERGNWKSPSSSSSSSSLVLALVLFARSYEGTRASVLWSTQTTHHARNNLLRLENKSGASSPWILDRRHL